MQDDDEEDQLLQGPAVANFGERERNSDRFVHRII